MSNVTLSQTFILQGLRAEINGLPRYAVNNVSYYTLNTPLKLADHFVNGSGVYQLDVFPIQSVNDNAAYGVSVVSGIHKGWLEIVFKNTLDVIDTWHVDGFGFHVLGKFYLPSISSFTTPINASLLVLAITYFSWLIYLISWTS